MKRCIIALCFLLSFIPASEIGKIKGRLVDTATNKPLVGVNIVIEGTELGAATDEDGTYIIPFVTVGTYEVTASYIGYNSVTKKDVTVISNQTTAVNFELDPTTIPMAPVVIVAEKPMVIKTQTQTRRTVTAEDITMLPITEINQIISLQAGVTESELGTHIRGGRGSEIVYFVDGIIAKAPHYGQQSVKINKEAVEEIGIITGGFDAEYGEALSGVVNIVTREGGEKPHGLFRYTTDELFRSNGLNYGYNLYECSFGGGLLDKSRFRYFLSGEAMLTDAYEVAKYRVPSERFDYKIEGKLSYRLPEAKGKVTLTGFYSREQFMHYQDIWGDLSFIFHLDHNTAELLKNYLSTLTFNYLPSKNSLIEAKFGYTKMTRFHAVRDIEEELRQGRTWYEDYIFKANHFPDILLNLDDDALIKSYLVDSLADSTMSYHYETMSRTNAASLRNNPFGARGFFYTVGDNRLWRYLYNHDYQGIFSFTNTIGKVHEVKVGVNIISQNIGWFDNNLPYYRIPFWDVYEKNPVKLAVYAQDVMDFEGIIARVGFRLDYFDSKATGLRNPADQTDSTMVETPPKWRISPRLGFSLPITDRSKLRFNYGHFYQTPTAHDLYRSTEPEVVWLLLRRYNSVVGNPNLTIEKTVAYELGYENQVSDIFAFGFVTYYKDIYDLIQTNRIVAMPYSYYQVFNADYGNVKGVEIIVKKKMHNFWSLDFSYTLQFAKGTASSAWQNYYEIYQDEPDPVTGEYPVPRIDYWLNFDERHIINSSLGFTLPQDFVLLPVRETSADFIFSYHSGFPYTPTDDKGKALGDQNSSRMPGYINVDANITKNVSVMGVKFSLFANLYNLFNTEQITEVYSTTGKPDDDGGGVKVDLSDFSPLTLKSSYYTPQADYNHDGINSAPELASEYLKARRFYHYNPYHWKQGFRAHMGLALKF